ncbi:Uncharacterized BCR, YitT family COG1284 [Mycoplasmopsis maculosa]|uniref:Uncharacterized BCR, YitT family COG1284 n=1 Tax=Mycoplasmopsis maculosa TaxID=114885 RepID=A0A449B3D6_9BACT|nr:YitT family protein [Mycoplasmopsis maculosa]VEU75096.1 Uncharacterized BCR, YitT family COG1284 [Mycoplasmopsis maculosa]
MILKDQEIKEKDVSEKKNKEHTCETNVNSTDDEEIVELDKLKMGRYAYETDLSNKKDKIVKKRIILLYLKRLFFIFIAAIIFNFGVLAFLNRADTIPSGLSGIPMLAILISKNYNVQLDKYFALMFLAVNIPLFLTFGLKEKRSFVLLTLYFMIAQILTNMVFTLTPGVSDWIHHHINVAPGWEKLIQVKLIGSEETIIYENATSWPILVNGILGSLCAGVAVSIAWKNGGSTGGTDIIAYYFSTKKQKSVSGIMFILNFCATSMFLIIFGFAAKHKEVINLELLGKYVDSSNINSTNGLMEVKLNLNQSDFISLIQNQKSIITEPTIVGLREISTFMYIVVNNIIISIIYPKYKKVEVQISCKNPSKIIKYFKKIKYWHAYTIIQGKSGYSGDNTYIVTTNMLLFETRSIISDINLIDPKAWISVKSVEKISGTFNTKFVER